MADEGDVQIEHQSNAGKWILILLAILVVAAFGYTQYASHAAVQKLQQDLSASQAQVKELQNRMQTAEAQEETLARQAGMTKKELAQRAAGNLNHGHGWIGQRTKHVGENRHGARC